VTIYLDYQATTPIAPEVGLAMRPWLEEKFANPHSSHAPGREAAATVELARDAIANLLPKGGQVYFTGGATEAINWGMRCAGEGGVMVVDTEHAAVRDTALWLRETGRYVSFMPVMPDGLVDAALPIPEGTGLVAVMQVNNEIGVVQPISALADAAHKAGALFLCDAVQGFGRLEIPEGPDLIAISAHKIHGPKGIGALWVRDRISITPLIFGGGQEGGLRSGTLSPALCAGFGMAADIARQNKDEDATHTEMLWQIAMEMLPDGWTVNGSTEHRYRGNLNLRREGLDAPRLISEVRGVSFSAGSACASGSGRPSHVLRALGLSDPEARSSIRLGFGRYTTPDEFREALALIFAAADSQKVLPR
jgi:cysteine desulfurase